MRHFEYLHCNKQVIALVHESRSCVVMYFDAVSRIEDVVQILRNAAGDLAVSYALSVCFVHENELKPELGGLLNGSDVLQGGIQCPVPDLEVSVEYLVVGEDDPEVAAGGLDPAED